MRMARSARKRLKKPNPQKMKYSVSVAAPVCKGAGKQFPGRTPDCINGARAGLYCWDTLWEVVATSTDPKTGVRQVITQGVAIPFEPGFNPATVSC